MTLDEIAQLWKTEVYDHAEVIDSTYAHDWDSLILGWCLGKGYTTGQAKAIRSKALAQGWL